jgi:hypothetical protein
MAKPSSEVVWTRILGCEGQVFTQIRGGEFSYLCSDESIDLSRTNQKIHRSQFEMAYEMVPLKSTIALQHLRAPSYLYAILMDPRIRREDW